LKEINSTVCLSATNTQGTSPATRSVIDNLSNRKNDETSGLITLRSKRRSATPCRLSYFNTSAAKDCRPTIFSTKMRTLVRPFCVTTLVRG